MVRVVSYLVHWLFSLFWAQCAHTQVLEVMESWVGPGNEASHVPYSLVNEAPWVHVEHFASLLKIGGGYSFNCCHS